MEKRCQNCGKFPFCERESNQVCENWSKREVEQVKENEYDI